MFRADIKIEFLNELNRETVAENLGIEFLEIGQEHLLARMPVDARTRQPFGLLHGGASVVLAETLGSVASNILIEEGKAAVGLEINANHLKAVKEGFVYGRVTPVHTGRSTHVWDIRITNEKDQLVCISRLTMSIIDRV